MSLGKRRNRASSAPLFFSPRASEARSFTQSGEQGSCVSGQGLECPRRGGEDLLWLQLTEELSFSVSGVYKLFIWGVMSHSCSCLRSNAGR